MKPKQALDIDALVAEAVPLRPDPQLIFTVDVKVVSEANLREHWRTKHGRKKKQQAAIEEAWSKAMSDWGLFVLWQTPRAVRFTRVGPRKLDLDNLAGSFKHVQDAIAKEIDIDDGDERVKWEYEQCAVGKRVYQVRVEVY